MPKSLLLALCLVLSTGCATFAKHQLGPPPTNADLQSDGSPGAKDRLYNEYSLEYSAGVYSRPRAAPRVENGRRIIYSAEVESNEAITYISSSPPAAAVYQGTLLTFYRATDLGLTYVVVDLGLVLLGVFGGAGTGAAIGASTANPNNIGTLATFGCIGGGLVALLTAAAFDAGLYYIGWPILVGAAQNEYGAVAQAYNQDLRQRIESAALNQSATGQPGPTPPPEEEAPATYTPM